MAQRKPDQKNRRSADRTALIDWNDPAHEFALLDWRQRAHDWGLVPAGQATVPPNPIDRSHPGATESLAGAYVGAGLKDLVVYVLFLLILLFKPAGLFGRAQ